MDDNVLYEYVWNPNTWEWELVPYDEVYHGTHVAGIIGAVGNNGAGVSGMSWDIKLMAVKVLDSVGGTDAATLADGIDYARTHGAQVVNASWGGSSYDQIVHDAVEALNDAGVVLVCAAGNDGLDNDGSAVYPANFGFPSTIVVGATDSFDVRSNWGAKATNYGRWSVDLFAPGTSIYSTLGGSRYRYMNGTSMAAPHVSGIIALAKAQFSAESATELVDRARWSSDSVSGLAAYCQSGGRANAAAALGPRPRLINLSSRCQVNTGDQIAISGIVITGPDSKRVAFRALGPSLPLSGALANPQLTVYNSNGTAIGSNDDWSSLSAADRNELISFGIAPSSSLESAWIGSLSPGAYSVHMSGAGGTTGVGLIESWDIDGSTANRMVNISTRCYVGTGDQVAIAGFAIAGTKPRQVYIRALGPTLTSYGVSGPLADTVIELHDSGGVIDSNDDWRSFGGTSTALETRLTNTGYPPTDNRESVIVRRLAPGNYTVILAGKSGATGVGLIEVNEY